MTEVQIFCTSAHRLAMPIRENDESDEAVAERVRAAIEARNIDQAEVARKLGTSASRVSNWATGGSIPRRSDAYALCDLLGITLDFLYRGRLAGMEWTTVQQLREVAARGVPPIRNTTHRPRRQEPPVSRSKRVSGE